MTDSPFTAIDVHLKHIVFGDLAPAAQKAILLCFYRFFAEEKPNPDYQGFKKRLDRSRQAAGISTVQQAPFRYRRFAGDASLPRGCYYSLADSPSSNDNGTLLHELIAYCDHDKCGRVLATDACDPNFADDIARYGPPHISVGERTIILAIYAEPVVGGELLREVQNLSLPAPDGWVRISIPYRTQQLSLDKVVDLRDAITREWIAQQLEHGLPGLAYQYGSVVSSQLISHGEPAKVDSRLWLDGYARPEEKRVITFGPADEWDHRCYGGPGGFFDILPYLVFGTNGGSPVTDAIGRWLRRLGANGLIYPSARNDVSCVYDHGKLVSWSGWNLVDFRGAPPPDWMPCLIVEPDSWRFQPGDMLVGGEKVENATEENGYDIQGRSEGPMAGSWWIKGRSKQTKDRFYILQRARVAGEEMRAELARQLAQAGR
jgi:hypothetical protein